MKHLKKFASLLLAMLMVMSLSANAFAAETGEGSITIKDSETVPVAGKTFNAYKILDVKSYTEATEGNEATVVYTVPDAMKSFYNNRYKDDGLLGTEGDYDAKVVKLISEKETDMFAFAADALAAAKTAYSNKPTGTGTAGEKDKQVEIKSLPLGYYVVEDTATEGPVSALILDTTNPKVEVSIKADMPDIEKNIDGETDTDNSTSGDVKNNTASVGDKVPYKLTSKVPDMTGYKKYYFVVTDTLSTGLTYNEDIAITFTRTAEDGKTVTTVKKLTNGTDYTAICTNNVLEIVFTNFIQYNSDTYKGADITITYSATVNKNAEIGTAGNPNSVKLTYSNDPTFDTSSEPEGDKPSGNVPTGETTEKKTRTFVTGVKLIKVDPQGNTLTGAQFQIEGEKTNIVLVSEEVFTEDADNGTYWKLKDGTYTTDDPNVEGMDTTKYESITVKYSKSTNTKAVPTSETVKAIGTVDENGELTFDGLSATTVGEEYTITELKAPAGYNLLEDPVKLSIGFTAPANDTDPCVWSYTWKQGEKTLTVAEGDPINAIRIVNNSGTVLPETGGIGTTIFYMAGGAMVLAAVILLVTKKRMAAAQ